MATKLNQWFFTRKMRRIAGKAYQNFLIGSDKPLETQEQLLLKIVQENRGTIFGIKYSFSRISSIKDYQENVPTQQYEDIRKSVEEASLGKEDTLVTGVPKYFASTSGSISAMKLIPMTQKAMASVANHALARLFAIFNLCPEAFSGNLLELVDPATEGETDVGIPYGSAHGILVGNASSFFRSKLAVPHNISNLRDVQSRYYGILRWALSNDISCIITTNPSNLLILAHKLNEWKDVLVEDIRHGTWNGFPDEMQRQRLPKVKPNPTLADSLIDLWTNDEDKILRFHKIWKNIKLISCWSGGNCQKYKDKLQPYFGNPDYIESGYLASELRGSLALRLNDPAAMLTITENFFEFVPVEEIDNPSKFYLCHELEAGRQYYVFVTNSFGLYRYHIHDIIEVRSFHQKTPEIVFVKKSKGITNIAGEKVYEQQMINVIETTNLDQKVNMYFSITLANEENYRYETYLECDLPPEKLEAYSKKLDENLKNENSQYATKRDAAILQPICVFKMEARTYEVFKKWHVSQGGQEDQVRSVSLTDDNSFLSVLKTWVTRRSDMRFPTIGEIKAEIDLNGEIYDFVISNMSSTGILAQHRVDVTSIFSSGKSVRVRIKHQDFDMRLGATCVRISDNRCIGLHLDVVDSIHYQNYLKFVNKNRELRQVQRIEVKDTIKSFVRIQKSFSYHRSHLKDISRTHMRIEVSKDIYKSISPGESVFIRVDLGAGELELDAKLLRRCRGLDIIVELTNLNAFGEEYETFLARQLKLSMSA